MPPAADRARRNLVISEAALLLARTPALLDAWLRGLPERWLAAHEGGHLVHGERTDWLPRLRRILESGDSVAFEPFDRLAQFRDSAGKTMDDLLDEFARLRAANVQELNALHINDAVLGRNGLHPSLGCVTLRQLIATWVAHDLDHVAQIARVMARQYTAEVGPWQAYLRIISALWISDNVAVAESRRTRYGLAFNLSGINMDQSGRGAVAARTACPEHFAPTIASFQALLRSEAQAN